MSGGGANVLLSMSKGEEPARHPDLPWTVQLCVRVWPRMVVVRETADSTARSAARALQLVARQLGVGEQRCGGSHRGALLHEGVWWQHGEALRGHCPLPKLVVGAALAVRLIDLLLSIAVAGDVSASNEPSAAVPADATADGALDQRRWRLKSGSVSVDGLASSSSSPIISTTTSSSSSITDGGVAIGLGAGRRHFGVRDAKGARLVHQGPGWEWAGASGHALLWVHAVSSAPAPPRVPARVFARGARVVARTGGALLSPSLLASGTRCASQRLPSAALAAVVEAYEVAHLQVRQVFLLDFPKVLAYALEAKEECCALFERPLVIGIIEPRAGQRLARRAPRVQEPHLDVIVREWPVCRERHLVLGSNTRVGVRVVSSAFAAARLLRPLLAFGHVVCHTDQAVAGGVVASEQLRRRW
eukprot:CAMPEP_0119411808 /NCGR_PEP_ID=MMETSP1335-20130426/4435_1 /TAXON_ID=259385 /ORGANISM="Chrysoculter rhomboideus, Strain RCC1486" /LENGTH=416 /DNA_ID=CAMNT_0007436477 /DNA_START=111 /DNA_END=1360 /DNA_ORIENTATION=-